MNIRNLFPATTGGIELFDEFFESGLEESISPFLTPKSRKWGKNIGLKSSLVSVIPLFCTFICSFFPGNESLSHLFLLITYFLAGIPALIASIEDILNFEINIDVLMTLAAFLSILIGSGREGALLLVLFSLSGSMEEAVRTKAKGAISSLKKLAPQKAYVVQKDGTLISRSIKDIPLKTQIHVKAGELIPLDGQVVAGSSSLNLAHLTGESLPVTCSIGDHVPAGGRNLEGALTICVTHTSSNSTLARIIQLIIQAQETKPKLQRWIDTLSNRYAISIISLAFIFALTFPWIFHIPYLGAEGSIYRALTFLIAASPCALIIAMPIAYLSAISCCAKQGILLKGGMVLDALAKCSTIAMDKTGTLTTGNLVCLEMITEKNDQTLLSIAYALERSAVHPIAQAITNFAEAKGVLPANITDFRLIPGYGLEGKFEDKEVRIGNPDWLLSDMKQVETIKKRGEIVTVLRVGEEHALFRFRDQIRPGVMATLRTLKEKWGMRLIMLSGDHEASARSIAEEVGLSEYYANLRPEDKLAYISQEENLAMVGDGINDAPALAHATVGISMGQVGSSTAIDASDIIFLQDRIDLLHWLVNKAHQVGRIVKQNVSIAAAAIFCATMPAISGWIPLWLAVLLHEGGTVLVGLNALRLLRKR
ncbi:MAG: heavy metal translocating P-type ATPase [Chlamydiales bacterium]